MKKKLSILFLRLVLLFAVWNYICPRVKHKDHPIDTTYYIEWVT